jgi:hypothetical protein
MSTENRPPWHNQPEPTRPWALRAEANAIIEYSEEDCPESGQPLGLVVFGVFLRLHADVSRSEKAAELQQAALRWLEERKER